jgi:hypothetical protein
MGINPPSLMVAFADRGIPGLGVRFVTDPRWAVPNPLEARQQGGAVDHVIVGVVGAQDLQIALGQQLRSGSFPPSQTALVRTPHRARSRDRRSSDISRPHPE